MATCGICKGEFKVITYNHLKLHNLTTNQYADLFPGSKFSWANGLTKKDDPRLKGSSKGTNMGHPPHFTKRYLGNRFDEINKTRIESLKKTFSEPKYKEMLILATQKGHEIRRKMPHYGFSQAALESFTRKCNRKGRHPWNFGLTKETDARVANIGENNRRLNIGKAQFNPDGWGKCGIRQDLNHFFRSKWEANIARLCNYLGVTWEYEPRRFMFDHSSYLPDFYLPECHFWIEVKGRLTDNARLRLAEMSKYYPNERVWLVDKYIYALLRKSYSSLIPNWEKETH
jgi:hypothetical protein